MPRAYSMWAEPGNAVRRPIHGRWGRQVVPALPPRHRPGLRLLVDEVQGFVAGIEVDAIDLADFDTGEGLHESQRIGDRFDTALVLGRVLRVAHEVEVPVLRMVKVGEPAVDQPPDEVQGQRRAVVATQKVERVGLARAGIEIERVDEVAPVGRQGLAAAGFGIG